MSLSEKENRTAILIIIIFLNLILISSQIIQKNNSSLLINVLQNTISPIQTLIINIKSSIKDTLNHYFFLTNIYKRFMKLKEENKKLKYEIYQLSKIIKTNKGFSNIKLKKNINFIKANLISIDFYLPYNLIKINRGEKHGIKKNMIVLNTYGELVGKITEPITSNTATVVLITSKLNSMGAYVKDINLEGLLSGNNTSICSFKYIIYDANIKKGDEIVSSGSDEIYPPYLPIGRVNKIEKLNLELKISIKPYFISKPIKSLLVISK